MCTNLIHELGYLFFLLTVLACVKSFSPVVNTFRSGLNRKTRKSILLKDRITVGCHWKKPQLMRSKKGMTTTPHRTCVGKAIIPGKGKIIITLGKALKAIIWKGKIFVSFAVLDLLQLVILLWKYVVDITLVVDKINHVVYQIYNIAKKIHNVVNEINNIVDKCQNR